MSRVRVIHGPSLGRLGHREPERYGRETLAALDARVIGHGATLGFEVECRQSNHEGQIIDWLLEGGFDGALLNAGAWAHTSLAIADAIRAIAPIPVVEVHLTNTVAREAIRHQAIVGAACAGRVEGFGGDSYLVGLEGLVRLLRRTV